MAHWRAQTRVCTAYSKFAPQLENLIQSRAGGKNIPSPLRLYYDTHYLRSSGELEATSQCTHVYALYHICASANAKVDISSCALWCASTSLRSKASRAVTRMLSGRIFFTELRRAYICKWNVFWRAPFHPFITRAALHSHVRNSESISAPVSSPSWALRCAKKGKEAGISEARENEWKGKRVFRDVSAPT